MHFQHQQNKGEGEYYCPQISKQDKKVIFSKQDDLAEYKNLLSDIPFQACLQQRIQQSNCRFQWAQFSEFLQFQTLEFDMQSLVVLAHYGNIKMKISTLMTFIDEQEIETEIIAEGAFGCIYKAQIDGKQYAFKGVKIVIDEGKLNLDHVYKEFFLSSIAQILEVGPKVKQVMGYDIITSKNSALFAMEMCKVLSNQDDPQQIYQHMIDNLRIIHSVGFVHLDIKPDNLAYSQQMKKYVFLDFGFSCLIKEHLGVKTLCNFAGTIGYCSEQMKKSYWIGNEEFIDLYYNDLVSVKKTYQRLLQNSKQSSYDVFKCERYQFCQKQQCFSLKSFLVAVVTISQAKYFLFTQNVKSLVDLIRRNLYLSKTFHAILSDEFKGQLRDSPLIMGLLSDLKQHILKYSFAVSSFDDQMSKLFSLKERPILTPHILTIDYTLQLPLLKFKRLLGQSDFVHRLFLVFDPISQIFPKKKSDKIKTEINSLRRKIVDKIFECIHTGAQKKQVIFYEKIRKVIIFFNEKLRNFKKTNLLLSLRLLFLLIEDFSYISQLEQEICCAIMDRIRRVFASLEFSLYRSQIYYIRNSQVSVFNNYLHKSTEVHEVQTEEFLRVHHFAIKLLSIENYLDCSHQFIDLALKQLQQFNSLYKLEEIANIQAIFCSLTRAKVLSTCQKTLVQCLYQKKYLQNLTWQYNQILRFFKLELTVEYSSMKAQSSVKRFKSDIQMFFQSLKGINMQQANFLTSKDAIFFYYDYNLAMALIQVWGQHITSFLRPNDQQSFRCFEVIDWMLRIYEGNNKVRKKINKEFIEGACNMIGLIQAKYNQLKNLSLHLRDFKWYSMTISYLDILIRVHRQNFDEVDLTMLRNNFGLPFYNISVMKIYLHLIYIIIEKSEKADSEISNNHLLQCQYALIEIHNRSPQRFLMELYEKTGLLELLIKIYIRIGRWEDSFDLIVWVVDHMNSCKNQVNAAGVFYIIKLAARTFRNRVGFMGWLRQLTKLRANVSIQWSHPEFIYLEFFLFYNIIKYLIEIPVGTMFQVFGNQPHIEIPSFRSQLVRIALGITQKKPVFASEVERGLYQCYRLNFKYKSERKKLMCLRKETRFKMIKTNWQDRTHKNSKKEQFKVIKKKLTKLCENMDYIVPTWDFIFG